MAKTLVMYSSKYGTTKKYAEWIAAELSGDMVDVKNVNQNDLKNYDTIILGSSLYAGNIKGKNIIINNYGALKNKKLVLFTCGLADYSKAHNVDAISKRLEKIIPSNVKQNMKIFYLRGGINYKTLSIKHRIMMGVMNKIVLIQKSKKMDDKNKEIIETYGQTIDFSDKNTITEIVDYCRNSTSNN